MKQLAVNGYVGVLWEGGGDWFVVCCGMDEILQAE